MPSRQIRRAGAILALTVACLVLPLSGLDAAPRSDSRWNGFERNARSLRQSVPFWNKIVSLWEKIGLRIDDNG